MKWSEMRVAPPAEHHFQQVSGIVRQEIHARKSLRQPARKQVDRQREPVHFGEQRHQKSRERTERTPVARRSGLSLIHISEPTRRTPISYAVFCLKKKNKH